MSVRVQCGACGSAYQVADASLGKRVKCKNCGTVFVAEAPAVETAAEVVPDDGEYDVAGVAPDVAPAAPAAAAAATTVWDAKRPSAAAVAAREEQAKPAWRKPGVLVPVGMLAIGGAIVAAVLLNRPAEAPIAAGGGGGTPGVSTASTRPRNAAAGGGGAGAGSSGAAQAGAPEPSAADASEDEVGAASELFSVGKSSQGKPGSAANPTPGPARVPAGTPAAAKGRPPGGVAPAVKSDPAGTGGRVPEVVTRPDGEGPGETAPGTRVPSPSADAGAPVEPPKTAEIQSSPKPTKWLVRPDPAKARQIVLSKNLTIPVSDAEVIFPDTPSAYVVVVHSRPEGFEWALWNLSDATRTYSFKSKDVLAEMIVSPDGILAAGVVPGRVNDVETWSLRQGTAGKRVREAEGEDTLVPACFVGEKTLVTTVAGTRKLTLWNVVSGKVAGEVALDRDLRFGGMFSQSPGGNYLALFADTRLLVYSLAEKELVGEVVVPERGDVSLDTAAGLTFAPDGSEIAAVFGGRGGAVRVVAWDVKTAKVTADVIAADRPGERLPAGTAQAIRPIAWLLDGTGWLLYGDLAVARAGGKTLFRQPAGAGGAESAARWRPVDRDSFLTFQGTGAKRVLKAVPVPRAGG